MEFCDRRRKLIDDSFFDEGYEERLNKFKTLISSTSSSNSSESSIYVDNLAIEFRCSVYRCNQSFSSMAKLENHVFYTHRHQCSLCHRSFSSEHLLSIHISENHDSYFRVVASKKKQPCYVCLVEDCKVLSMTGNARKEHLIQFHKFPESFEFFEPPKKSHHKTKKGPAPTTTQQDNTMMMMMECADDDMDALGDALSNLSVKVPASISFGRGGRGRGRRGGSRGT
eukprot:gene27079-35557_t